MFGLSFELHACLGQFPFHLHPHRLRHVRVVKLVCIEQIRNTYSKKLPRDARSCGLLIKISVHALYARQMGLVS
jgi:hypothetical protein